MINEEINNRSDLFEIKVPYGHIAGKVWNSNGKSLPILALHGWMDNAGTWDAVAPLIKKNFPVYAVDLPGHGLSSHVPLGAGGYFTDHLVSIERIIQHFQWKELILLGHSMGGGASMLYAGTFPDKIKKLILVDILNPMSIDPSDQPTSTAKFLTELLLAENKILTGQPPHYEHQELVKKLVASYRDSIDESSASILLKRGAKKHSDGKYSLRYSPILRVPSGLSTTFEQQLAFAENIDCDVLMLKSGKALHFSTPEKNSIMLETIRKSSKSLRLEIVKSTHHMQLRNPEIVVKCINDFLLDILQSEESKVETKKYVKKYFNDAVASNL